MILPAHTVYWADGVGSCAVFDSLYGILTELRGAVLSDRAIALYQPVAAHRGWFVLSDSCQAGVAPALANEMFYLPQPLTGQTPTRVSGVSATSALRPFRLAFGSALAIPWDDPFGRGVVLIGVQDHGVPEQSLERLRAITDTRRLASTLSESRMSGTLSLQRQLGSALRDVLAQDTSAAGPIGRISSLVRTARELFKCDTAYLSLPEEGTHTHYFFASFSNVNTPQFRQLRMEFGQGLGGLARREGRAVSSMNYVHDERLVAPPVSETIDEGIVSAVAAPLLRANDILGVLYVGSRSARPYSETDERVLAEFAEYAALLMDSPAMKTESHSARLGRLREDFAHAIHDSVVRSLVQIGFTAEQASRSVSDRTAMSAIEAIRSAAEEALSNLRKELSGLVVADSTQMNIGQILEQIARVPTRPGVARHVLILGSAGEAILPAGVAEVLVQVGAEALTNSLKHSECKNQTLEVKTTPELVTLKVCDDGRGSPLLDMAPSQLAGMGHLGLASMHRRVQGVAGQLSITSGIENGTSVYATIPRTWT